VEFIKANGSDHGAVFFCPIPSKYTDNQYFKNIIYRKEAFACCKSLFLYKQYFSIKSQQPPTKRKRPGHSRTAFWSYSTYKL